MANSDAAGSAAVCLCRFLYTLYLRVYPMLNRSVLLRRASGFTRSVWMLFHWNTAAQQQTRIITDRGPNTDSHSSQTHYSICASHVEPKKYVYFIIIFKLPYGECEWGAGSSLFVRPPFLIVIMKDVWWESFDPIVSLVPLGEFYHCPFTDTFACQLLLRGGALLAHRQPFSFVSNSAPPRTLHHRCSGIRFFYAIHF